MKPVEVMLKEYETLRQQQALALSQGYQLVGYGLVALALLGAGTFAVAGEAPFAGFVPATLCYVIPLLASLILLLWVGQHDRRRWVGDYLVTLEIDINDTLGKDALVWENYVRHHRPLRYPDLAVVVLLLGITLSMPLLGQQAAGLELGTLSAHVLVPWLLGALVGGFVLVRVFRPREQAAIPRERMPWEAEELVSQGAYVGEA